MLKNTIIKHRKGADKSVESHVFYPYLNRKFAKAVKGEGVYLYDSEGKRYIDGSAGAMTANLGHGLKEVTQRVKEQLDTLTFTYRTQFTNEPMEELSAKIARLAPGSLNRVHYVNSGSEAAEQAMKLVRSYWLAKGKPGREMVISRWGSYHGSTMGSLSMSGNVGRRQAYHTYLKAWPQIDTPHCLHCPYEKTYPACDLYCARELEKVIGRTGAGHIAAFISEPVIGASGAGITPPPEYFPLVRDICHKHDILFIMDEVITGFGRTGEHFACQHWQVEPDLIVFGKGVSAGYGPLAGLIASDAIYQTIQETSGEFTTGHTFGGNPLCCAAGCSVMDYMEKHRITEQVKDKGVYLKKKLQALQPDHPLMADVRGLGLLLGVELMKDRDRRVFFEPHEKITDRLVERCFENGLVVYPSTRFIHGVRGDSLLISPPLTITYAEMDELVALLAESLNGFA